MTNVNCQSSNLIYVITCNSCGIQYVGQTKNHLLTWFQGHFNDIAHNCDTTVARHLNICKNNTNPTSYAKEFSISITSFITSPPESPVSKQLRDREERNNALQTLGVPRPKAKGPPGPGGHYFFTNNALMGILNVIALDPNI